MSIQSEIAYLAPSFFRQQVGGKVFESLAAAFDMLIESQVIGLQQGDPLRCDVSALPYLGRDRGLRRYPSETEGSYRLRLAGWRETKRHWGSLIGQMRQLQIWFSPLAKDPSQPVIRAVHQRGDGSSATWHTLDHGQYTVTYKTPSNWKWSPQFFNTAWSRYWIIVYTDQLDPSMLIDAAKWDGGGVYDSSMVWDGLFSAAQIADMVSVCKDWKAAHSRLAGLILASDKASFDPTAAPVVLGDGTTTLPLNGNWSSPTDPITGLPTRLATAEFAYLDPG